MIIQFETVAERDIDLLIMRNLAVSSGFLDFFLSKINKKDYAITSLQHSYMDESGESDITVILDNGNNKIGILIEDKINASAMPEQCSRYMQRGQKAIDAGIYDEMYLFIVCPEEYYSGNSEAKKYPNHILYEELIPFCDNEFDKALLSTAIGKKGKGYSPIEDKGTTAFWPCLYDYVETQYPKLRLIRTEGIHGRRSLWPEFITPVKGVRVVYKSPKSVVDLTFGNMAGHYKEFSGIVEPYLSEEMSIQKAGKSLVIRKNVPFVDFHLPFEDQINKLKICLDAVSELQDLLKRFDADKLIDVYKMR